MVIARRAEGDRDEITCESLSLGWRGRLPVRERGCYEQILPVPEDPGRDKRDRIPDFVEVLRTEGIEGVANAL